MQGKYLAMFTDNINNQPMPEPRKLSEEEKAIYQQEAAEKLTDLASQGHTPESGHG